MSQPHSLMWGDLRLAGDAPLDPDVEFVIEAKADGTKLGTAKALTEFVKSLQVDGSLAVSNGYDNADLVLSLRITPADGVSAGPALAKAAKALAANAAADPIPPLVWVPPLEEAATCVYDIESATPVRDEGDDWDLDEEMRECRYFTVTMSRHPFARPLDPVVVPALPAQPPTETKVDIDTCDSTTGWTQSAKGFGPYVQTNPVTNPSGETNTTGWTVGALPKPGTSSLTRQTSGGRVGPCWLRLNYTTGSPNEVAVGSRMYLNGPLITSQVTPGEVTNVLISQNAPVSNWGMTSATGGVMIRFYDAGGVQIGADTSTTWTINASWKDFTTSREAPAGAAQVRVFPFLQFTSSAQQYGATFGIDRVLIGPATTYFDGDTTSTAQWTYAWTGTAHASSSTATSTTPANTFGATGGHIDLAGISSPDYPATRTLSLTRSGAVSMGTSPYLRVSASVTATSGTANPPSFKIGTGTAVAVEPIGFSPSAIAGYTDYYFTTGNFDRLVAEATAPGGVNQPNVTLSVAHVARTNLLVTAGTPRQQSRIATIFGSAPTQAAIRLYDATPAPLGNDVFVYSTKNSTLAPPMRPFLTSGGATTDTAMISGARNTLASPAVIRVPAAKLLDGMYALVGRLNVTTAGTLGWSTRIVDAAGAATIGSSLTDSGSIEVPVTGGYRSINLAAMLLPPVEVEGNQLVEITITGTANMTWDEFWLFNLTEGSLTWIRDADSMTWIEVRPPELGKLPSIYGGTGAFGTNPVCVDYKTIGSDFGAADQHYAEPGLLQIFTVTSTSTKAQAELWFYPRYLDAVLNETA